jgi:polar amino acid transport system substrate-binding protein
LRFARPYAVRLASLAIWIVLCISPNASFAEQRLTITLTLQDYPPFTFGDDQNAGLLTEIVRESFKLTHVDVEFVTVPNNRAITGLLRGLYDGSYGWAHSPERDSKLLYSTAPIYSLRIVFFQKNGNEITWKSLEDLTKYRIGVTLGNYYSNEFDALVKSGKFFADPVNDDVVNLKKLALGRIDLFPIDQDVGQYLAKRYLTKADQQKIMMQHKAIVVIPVYLVVRRDLSHAREICDRFDQGYQQLASSGRLQKMLDAFRSKLSDRPQ